MQGEIRLAPAILFRLLCVVGMLVFVSGHAGANRQSTLRYRALFVFCYATFELTIAVAAQASDLAGGHGRCKLWRS